MSEVRVIGRYALHGEIASGGMARVHLGRLVGPVGFARIVAIKRLHPNFTADPEFVAMFLDEARVAARIRHPNVVPILDVVALKGELFLVLEYVRGESLSRLLMVAAKRKAPIPPDVVATIMIGTLEGLHAAHDARSERGQPLDIVHRDVSPANVLVGADGIPRVLDFGVAKAAGRIQTTRDGQLKGKVAYMAPEQVDDGPIDRRTDVWAASVVLWELLALQRLFTADNPVAMMRHILHDKIVPPSFCEGASTTAFDAIVLRGLSRRPSDRFPSARDMAIAIEGALTPATARAVGAWVEATAGDALLSRAALVEELESSVNAGDEPHPSLTLNSRLAAAFGDEAAEIPGRPPPYETTVDGPRAQGLPPPPPPPSHAPPPYALGQPDPGVTAFYSQPPPPPSIRGGFGASSTAVTPRPKTARPFHRVLLGFATGFLIVLSFWAIRRYSAVEPKAGHPLPGAPTLTVFGAASVPAPTGDPTPPDVGGMAAAAAAATAGGIRPAVPSATAATAHRRPAATPACNPPYSVGPPPDYIRKPKPECFPN